jgi:chromosomal replication initiation ATPase DnaA
VTAVVAAAFAVPVADLCAPTRRSASVAFARQSAMYLSHVALGMSLSAVGRAFGRDRSTAAHACNLIEDRRDDPAIDAMLAGLEEAVGSMRDRAGAGREVRA